MEEKVNKNKPKTKEEIKREQEQIENLAEILAIETVARKYNMSPAQVRKLYKAS